MPSYATVQSRLFPNSKKNYKPGYEKLCHLMPQMPSYAIICHLSSAIACHLSSAIFKLSCCCAHDWLPKAALHILNIHYLSDHN